MRHHSPAQMGAAGWRPGRSIGGAPEPMQLEDLIAQLAALPDSATLPVGWIRDQLSRILAPQAPIEDPSVLDVGRLAARWKRSPSAVRALLEAGAISQAWKIGGRAWRVRLADVEAYEGAEAAKARRVSGPGAVPDLRAAARGEVA